MLLARMIPIVACMLSQAIADDPPVPRLTMTPGIVCEAITGYDDYTPREDAVLTKDDKLLIYYEATGFEHEFKDKQFHVHLVQDARIRRRSDKKVLQSKDEMVDYKGKFKELPRDVYLSNVISLKPLPPGEYDLEIILHDALAPPKTPATSQVVPFRVKPPEPEKP